MIFEPLLWKSKTFSSKCGAENYRVVFNKKASSNQCMFRFRHFLILSVCDVCWFSQKYSLFYILCCSLELILRPTNQSFSVKFSHVEKKEGLLVFACTGHLESSVLGIVSCRMEAPWTLLPVVTKERSPSTSQTCWRYDSQCGLFCVLQGSVEFVESDAFEIHINTTAPSVDDLARVQYNLSEQEGSALLQVVSTCARCGEAALEWRPIHPALSRSMLGENWQRENTGHLDLQVSTSWKDWAQSLPVWSTSLWSASLLRGVMPCFCSTSRSRWWWSRRSSSSCSSSAAARCSSSSAPSYSSAGGTSTANLSSRKPRSSTRVRQCWFLRVQDDSRFGLRPTLQGPGPAFKPNKRKDKICILRGVNWIWSVGLQLALKSLNCENGCFTGTQPALRPRDTGVTSGEWSEIDWSVMNVILQAPQSLFALSDCLKAKQSDSRKILEKIMADSNEACVNYFAGYIQTFMWERNEGDLGRVSLFPWQPFELVDLKSPWRKFVVFHLFCPILEVKERGSQGDNGILKT